MSAAVATTTVDANAKVNLTLAVGPLRQDGYHRVVTTMQALELHDTLHVEAARADVTDVEVSAPGLDGGDTLCTRAARDWSEAAGVRLRVRVAVDKVTPAGAGFGGGSSDAAATLRALNELAPQLGVEPLPVERMLELGTAIGSDVPFFLGVTGSAVASGRGDEVLDVPPLPALELLLLWPGVTQPTAAVYAAYNPRRDFMPPTIGAVESARNGHFYNDLAGTALALCPPMRALESALRAAGATPFVAGSGSGLVVRLDQLPISDPADPAVGQVAVPPLDPAPLISAAQAAVPDLWHTVTRSLHA